jgi:hypothetical protein
MPEMVQFHRGRYATEAVAVGGTAGTVIIGDA